MPLSTQSEGSSQLAAAWLFAYSPDRAPGFELKVKAGVLPTLDWWGWTRPQHDVAAGDRVFVYRFGDQAAIVATAHARGQPRPATSNERLTDKAFEYVVDIIYDELQPSPLLKNDLPGPVRRLTIIQGKGGEGPAMGTNFRLSLDQSSTLERALFLNDEEFDRDFEQIALDVPPQRHAAIRMEYRRDRLKARQVQERQNYRCLSCNTMTTWQTRDGHPYLETHHVSWLSEGGLDVVRNLVGLCAECHRRAHYAADCEEFNADLRKRVAT
jgi:hypothetical protein